MVKYILKGLPLVILSMAVLGCGQKAKIVAKVDRHAITQSDIEYRISKLPAYYQEISRENPAAFVDEIIADFMLYDEALKRGLDKDKDVKSIFEEAKKKILIARLIKDQIDDKTTVSDQEVQEYYDANRDQFFTPEKLRASHILVKDQALAQDLLGRLNGGADFSELAKEYSIDLTAEMGGDVGYFTKGQLVSEFEEACSKLPPGQISGDIVKTQFGYHIIMLTDRVPSAQVELKKVADGIRDKLLKDKKHKAFNDFLQGLKKKADITVNKELLR